MRFLPLILAAGLSLVCVTRGEAQGSVPETDRTAAESNPTETDHPSLSGTDVLALSKRIVAKNTKGIGLDEILKGVTHASLSIEDIPPVFSGVVSEEELKTAIELRCRSHGFRIVDNDKFCYLYIRLGAVSDSAGGAASDVSVQLKRAAILLPDLKSMQLVTVWDKAYIFHGGRRHRNASEIQKNVFTVLDEFLNEWLKQNGK